MAICTGKAEGWQKLLLMTLTTANYFKSIIKKNNNNNNNNNNKVKNKIIVKNAPLIKPVSYTHLTLPTTPYV